MNDVQITMYGYDKKTLTFVPDMFKAYEHQFGWQRCHDIHSPNIFTCQGCEKDHELVDECHYYEREGYNIDLCNDCAGKIIYPDLRTLMQPSLSATPGVSRECTYHSMGGDYVHSCNERPAYFHESQNWICRKHLDEYCGAMGETLNYDMSTGELVIGDYRTNSNSAPLHDVEELERAMCTLGYAPAHLIARYHLRGIREWKLVDLLGTLIKNIKESKRTFSDILDEVAVDGLKREAVDVDDDYFSFLEVDPRTKACLRRKALDEIDDMEGDIIIEDAIRCALPDFLDSIAYHIEEQTDSRIEYNVNEYRNALERSGTCDPCDCTEGDLQGDEAASLDDVEVVR